MIISLVSIVCYTEKLSKKQPVSLPLIICRQQYSSEEQLYRTREELNGTLKATKEPAHRNTMGEMCNCDYTIRGQ